MFRLKLSEPTKSDGQFVKWVIRVGGIDGKKIKVKADSRFIQIAVAAPKYLQVEDCIVSIRSVRHAGKTLNDYSSPLSWTGTEGPARFKPQRLASGDRKLVDVCKFDTFQRQLQLLSERSVRGADIYAGEGTYELVIVATGKNIRKAETTIRVRFSPTVATIEGTAAIRADAAAEFPEGPTDS